MIRREFKFALPVSFGLLLGVVTGAFMLFLVVGTAFGLVWGYADTMLNGHAHKKPTVKKTRSAKPQKAAKKRRK